MTMDDQVSTSAASTKPRRRWYQFNLRTLLIFITIVAALLATTVKIYDWYQFIPLSTKLAIVNADFNTQYKLFNDPNPLQEPPITEDEVVRAIESKVPNLKILPRMKARFLKIAETRRIPRDRRDASFDYFPVNDTYWIRLCVGGYGLPIRDTGRKVEPVPQKKNGNGAP
jgi:hypothetical protein